MINKSRKIQKGFIQHRFKESIKIQGLSQARNGAGFTLIEFLIYMGIFSILLVVTLEMFSSLFNFQTESEATSFVSADGKFIMGRFTHDMNRAESITVPSTTGSASATLSIIADSQSLRYSLSGGDLMLENLTTGTADRLNSSESSVSNLSFLRLDGEDKDVVQVSFTLTSVTIQDSGREVINYETSGGLR